MTKYEQLLSEYDNKLIIEEQNMITDGLYSDGVIWIKDTLNTADKLSVVAEEIGHYETSTGDILDQTNISNIKQEQYARKWAYEKIITLSEILSAFRKGHKEVYDLAELFEVTEDFMRGCLKHYGFLE